MRQFPEMNWSAFIRKLVEDRVKQLSLKQELLAKLKEENESGFTDWTVELGRKIKKEGHARLKKEGLL
ncbi:MAG: hypothetical protein AABX85_03150 [Nanoarchaeota archaeon]